MRHPAIVDQEIELGNPRLLLEPRQLVNHLSGSANKSPLLFDEVIIGKRGVGLPAYLGIEGIACLFQLLLRVADEFERFARIDEKIEEIAYSSGEDV